MPGIKFVYEMATGWENEASAELLTRIQKLRFKPKDATYVLSRVKHAIECLEDHMRMEISEYDFHERLAAIDKALGIESSALGVQGFSLEVES